MFTSNNEIVLTKEDAYKIMLSSIKDEINYEADLIANLSNISSIIMTLVTDINWVGFYVMKNGELVVGPFQGKPACTRIKVGKGVCGAAVEKRNIQRIYNVHEFPGHIACDSASNSELVIPIILENIVLGVLDIDSELEGRFIGEDEIVFAELVEEIKKCNWKELFPTFR